MLVKHFVKHFPTENNEKISKTLCFSVNYKGFSFEFKNPKSVICETFVKHFKNTLEISVLEHF